MPDAQAVAAQIAANVEKVILGKSDVVRDALVALFAGGHALLEDVPGVGKTMLAKAVARSIDGEFKRIQFTPDLLPSDVTGVTLYDQHLREFRFRPGPVFAAVLLADEINRASPKTQSALLECMAEQTVTVDGEVRPLALPHLVIATQNPTEHEGVYPLPESQLDRFMLRLRLGYPAREHERRLLRRDPVKDPIAELSPVVDLATVRACQAQVIQVTCSELVEDYLLDLIAATRRDPRVRLGASPRAAQTLATAARALALIEGRDYVRPDDIQRLAGPVLAHRLAVHGTAYANGQGALDLLRELIEQVPIP